MEPWYHRPIRFIAGKLRPKSKYDSHILAHWKCNICNLEGRATFLGSTLVLAMHQEIQRAHGTKCNTHKADLKIKVLRDIPQDTLVPFFGNESVTASVRLKKEPANEPT